ncbi:MAG: Na+/Ca+ antiporter, CaCA family [candidate division TA06 bacterium 32_111]|uniref:Na+/Ca+ antiporter, CaCA family n=2 Tax=Bacteria candidate phyla TaxID=1783234 RepID=A0A101I1T5_UNCT6|nr:MAG: Na+/Ca+ antiporter, CaCA family [candidate division TA06 bacterium 32_111]KUK87226.1 MAG: Na+/Ca+ antiporter, CaCA family [candidate division TA06 bacterium 34_109]HAF07390.1 sodium:proton exchanger [candidate division WOR-3 bacterium]HCP16191.1 sodium:proton exchanger [candidate division WOR-3 bacterium]
MLFLQISIFFISLYLLIKSANIFVEGSSSIAARLKISQIAIGLTLVSIGTSLPEMVINFFASLSGNNEIVFGNVVGSNITNILLILGVSGLINPIVVKKNTTYKEIPFSFLSTLILFILVNDKIVNGRNFENILSRSDGIILLIMFFGFIYYVIKIAKVEPSIEERIKVLSLKRSILFIIFGIILLSVSAKFTVQSAVYIARFFKVSEALISLTAISVGTSLPELITSSVASFKKNSDIAIGNLIGSNVSNILFILGISSCIKNIHYKTFFNFDILILFYSTTLLFSLMFIGKRYSLGKRGSFSMLVSYLIYLIIIILRK